MNDLYQNSQKYFEIVLADTTELLEHVYRIRYQVLCVQNTFPDMDAIDYPDKMERDEYDDHSCHALLRFRPSGDFVGAVRLILCNPLQPGKLFPVELNTQLDTSLCNIKALPRQQIAEISRSVVIRQFERRERDRRCINDRRQQEVNVNSEKRATTERRSSDRRATPHLSLLLMAAVLRMSVKYNIRHWFSATEPALNRLLGFYGLSFTPVGPPVSYHGIRRPYYMQVEDALNKMYKEYHDAWEVLTECGEFNPIQSS